MKKIVLGILSIFIILIVSFIVGIQLSSTIKKSERDEIADTQQNIINENKQENNIENKNEQENNTEKKYYLHRSDIEIPDKNKCSIAKIAFFKGISESDKEEIQKEIRDIHYQLEYLLVDTVSFLKDSNSPYWSMYAELGVHEEPGHPETKVESHGFANKLEKIQKMTQKLKNEQVKNDLQKSCEILQEGIDKHDIGKCFEAHETIHDYDYWVANSPLSYITPPADWGGIRVYFGKVSIM